MKKSYLFFQMKASLITKINFIVITLDLKSTPEGLNKKFDINLLGRKSYKKRSHEIKVKNIRIFSNIFSYISAVIKASKIPETKFLIISISPYTFIASLFIKLFGKKPIVYLRSDGFGEYS